MTGYGEPDQAVLESSANVASGANQGAEKTSSESDPGVHHKGANRRSQFMLQASPRFVSHKRAMTDKCLLSSGKFYDLIRSKKCIANRCAAGSVDGF